MLPISQITDEKVALEIGLPEELLDFARMVNSGELSGRADVKVRLTADIDLTGHQWTPIGLGKAQFAGRFDGCGHTISAVTIQKKWPGNYGLFGYVTGAIQNVTVTGTKQVGGLVGWAQVELDKENALIPVGFDNTPRQRIGYNEALRRTFRDERVAFTAEQVQKETARCLSCGASVVDPNKCIGCGVCTTKCAFDAIHLHRERPECTNMIPSEDKMKAILPYMVKRQIKIRKAGKK